MTQMTAFSTAVSYTHLVYEIRAAEDVVTPDGTLRYSKGELVDTVTTDETGFAISKELYLSVPSGVTTSSAARIS